MEFMDQFTVVFHFAMAFPRYEIVISYRVFIPNRHWPIQFQTNHFFFVNQIRQLSLIRLTSWFISQVMVRYCAITMGICAITMRICAFTFFSSILESRWNSRVNLGFWKSILHHWLKLSFIYNFYRYKI